MAGETIGGSRELMIEGGGLPGDGKMTCGAISGKVIEGGIVGVACETICGPGELMIKSGDLPAIGDMAGDTISGKVIDWHNGTVAPSAGVGRTIVLACCMTGVTPKLCVLPDQGVKSMFGGRAVGGKGNQLRVKPICSRGAIGGATGRVFGEFTYPISTWRKGRGGRGGGGWGVGGRGEIRGNGGGGVSDGGKGPTCEEKKRKEEENRCCALHGLVQIKDGLAPIRDMLDVFT